MSLFSIFNILENDDESSFEPDEIEDNIFFTKYNSPMDEIGNSIDQLYATPTDDIANWHQQSYPDTCAIVAQEYILESFLGKDFSEEALAIEAMSKGYYWPGVGTYPEYVGSLLEDYGVDIERSTGNSIEDIVCQLEKNQKVIVCVDASEIWNPSAEEQLKDLFYMPEANHAVTVIGYDDSSQTIILNDPGHPEGGGFKVTRADFENAWSDSNNFMVYTLYYPPVLTV